MKTALFVVATVIALFIAQVMLTFMYDIPDLYAPILYREMFIQAFEGNMDAIRFWAPIVNSTTILFTLIVPAFIGHTVLIAIKRQLFEGDAHLRFRFFAVLGVLFTIVANVISDSTLVEYTYVYGSILTSGLYILINHAGFNEQKKQKHISATS